MELNYNRDLLKSILTMLRENDGSCSSMYCENIVIFNSKYHAPADKALTSTDPHYYELARADFAIQTDDKALREQFESIKRHILNNRDKQNG